MINPQWYELPMSKTNLYGPKDVRVIKIRQTGALKIIAVRDLWQTNTYY